MIFANLAHFRAAGFRPRVAVIGSGPAGITVARKLAASRIPVVVFEAGSDDYTDTSQDFYRGTTVGDTYFDLDVARLRFLGGTSNHWAGWCRVLDEVDFEPKAWVPDTGWPIRRKDIDPYLDEVRGILELPPFEPDERITDDIRWVQLIKSPAVHFGERFRGELQRSRDIAVVLNTYVTELVGDGRRVTGLKLWADGAEAGGFAADYVVVAVGGL
jgi:choline dehydrogenase-like flavoprotein